MRFYPSRARRSSCWSTCPPPVSAGMRVPCANRTDSSTRHQRYHLLSAADLNSSRNRNFVHMKGERSGVVGPAFAGGTRQNSTRLLYRRYIEILKAEVGPATTAGGPTHGAAKMTGGRSPPQLYFSLSWQDLSSTAAAFTFRSLCIGALQVAPVRRKPRVGQAVVWRRSSFASFDIGLGSGR